ncbi:MAG: phenylacetate-CoA oxygenase subunit PaaJ [Bacteroidetes bacterium]|nr:MAG: phenylacetate-CoA oxygenase subunit PaaJ [Bacteroidota bacterium]
MTDVIKQVYTILENVKDPEIPVLSLKDLGVIRHIKEENGKIIVEITPTYSGCPAMHQMEQDILAELRKNGFNQVEVKTLLSPSWTTEWITEEGKRKLREYGIAPPNTLTADKNSILGKEKTVKCPRCGSSNTQMISQFGSTACKALFKCNDCLEPFDYFKCL